MPDPPASSYLALRGRSASASMRLSDAKNREERYKELVEEVLTTLKNRGEHAKFAMLDVRDIVCTSADVTYAQAALRLSYCVLTAILAIFVRLVGCGTHSNEAGFNLMMVEGVWKTDTIAHVRDIFDFHESRPFLSSYFQLASEDATVVLEVRFFLSPIFIAHAISSL